MSVIYSVQSYSPIKGGVRPDCPIQTTSESAAIRSAQKQAMTTAGAVVICTTMNEVGEVASAEIMAVFGVLPDYVLERLTVE